MLRKGRNLKLGYFIYWSATLVTLTYFNFIKIEDYSIFEIFEMELLLKTRMLRNCRANFKVTKPIYVVKGWWNWKWTNFPELKRGVPSKCSQSVKSKHFAFIFDGNESQDITLTQIVQIDFKINKSYFTKCSWGTFSQLYGVTPENRPVKP